MSDIIKHLKNIIENIINNNDIVTSYRELAILFENQQMYQEQVGCLERIAHITKEPYLYEEMGNIFKFKLNNYSAAFGSYSKYLSLVQPDFYQNYIETFDVEFLLTDLSIYNQNFIILVDKCIVIIYILVYLYNINNYDGILELEKYYDLINNNINNELKKISPKNKDIWEATEDAKKHLSSLLVNNIENKNINQLAIKLDKKNEYAYINVIYNYLNNNEFELALEIFNNNYAKEFNLDNIQNKKRLMWFTASKYLEYKRPFEAVNCQKMVIDTELISYEK